MRLKVQVILLVLLLCAAFTACGNTYTAGNSLQEENCNIPERDNGSEERQESEETKTLTDFFPPFATLKEVYVFAGTTSREFPNYRVLVIANESEKEALLKCLTVPLEGFYETKESVMTGGSISVVLWIETDEGDYTLTISSGDRAQKIRFSNFHSDTLKGTEVNIVGPPDVIPFYELNKLTSDIRDNTTDSKNIGTVTYGDNEPVVISKVRTATARNILDGTLEVNSSTAGADDGLVVTFEGGPYIYRINPETGYFSRERDGTILYGQMEDPWREYTNSKLGLPLFSTNE